MACGSRAMSGPLFLSDRKAALALLVGCIAPGPLCAQRPLGVSGLRVEYLTNPVGIDAAAPRLSWRLESTTRNTVQSAYQLQVAASEADLGRGTDLLWDSGKVASDASVLVDYSGPALGSRTRYYWRVRVWDARGRASPWSAVAYWETALLRPDDWTANWIGPAPSATDSLPSSSPLLRRAFRVGSAVAAARLYVTSLGLYELHLNGQRVGDQLFTPGWTSYHRRLQYQTYDVTRLLRAGENVIGAMLGDGWYRGYLGFNGQRNLYGRRLALRLQLEIRYQDGRTERVTSDTGWRITPGPVVGSDIYGGETYDARREHAGWSTAAYRASDWDPVALLEPPPATLIAPVSPAVRRVRELRPIAIRQLPSGEMLFDLGQNFTGWVRLKVRGSAGSTVTLRFAEVLDRAGNIYTANLRNAKQTDRYTLKGGGAEIFEPHFTFHGFRYVAVHGLPERPDTGTITGIAVSSDLAQTGTLVTSDSLLNQLQRNIVWGQRSNFLDVPTDCPQRDERLGWTGDAQVFARTAAFNMDVAGFFAKWLSDVAADQDPSGSVPWVIPNPLGGDSTHFAGTAGWSDVAVIVPWTMYLTYGDRRLLERQYASMRAWVEYMRAQAGEGLLWTKGFHFGDWLAFQTIRADYPGATTDKDLIATAHFAHSTDLLARAAEVLGRSEDARTYRQLFERIRAAFQREYVTATGRLTSNTQTAYVLALDFDLVTDSLRAEAARRLAEDVRRMGHLTTGFLGTPALTRMLSENGYLADAYRLLLNERYPSWLYEVKQGATTVWERWDGQKSDSTFQEASMNSFNHYAYGAVGDWLYRVVAGLNSDPAEPGYKHIVVRPQPGGGFTYANAALITPYGEAASGWKLEGNRLQVTARVPANAHATVYLPGARLDEVRDGSSPLASTLGVRRATQSGDTVVVEIGSGHYEFVYDAAGLAARIREGVRRWWRPCRLDFAGCRSGWDIGVSDAS